MNLCVNARDAMPRGGEFVPRAENTTLDDSYARMHLEARPGRYVLVIVAGAGSGIAPEAINRIFEPFFTTEGTKTEYMAANREVCFQVEEVEGATSWRSVMLTGRAGRLTSAEETERAMLLVSERNPTLAPAFNRTKIGPWTRLTHVAIYRIRPRQSTAARPTAF